MEIFKRNFFLSTFLQKFNIFQLVTLLFSIDFIMYNTRLILGLQQYVGLFSECFDGFQNFWTSQISQWYRFFNPHFWKKIKNMIGFLFRLPIFRHTKSCIGACLHSGTFPNQNWQSRIISFQLDVSVLNEFATIKILFRFNFFNRIY